MGRKTHKKKVAERRRLRNIRFVPVRDKLEWTEEEAAESPGEQALPDSLKEASNEIRKQNWFKAAYMNGKFESANEAADAVVKSANLNPPGKEWLKLEGAPVDCIAHDIEFGLAHGNYAGNWNTHKCRSFAESLLIPVEETSIWLTNQGHSSGLFKYFSVSRFSDDRAYVAVGEKGVYMFCFFGQD